MTMYLRSKKNGIIHDYVEILADNPDWEAITEQQAFPEKFAPVDIKARAKKVDLTVPKEAVTPPSTISTELSAQKGRTFSTVGEVQATKVPNKPVTIDAAGLKGEF